MENPRTDGLNIDEIRFQLDYLFVISLAARAVDVLGRNKGGRGGTFDILTRMAREADTTHSEAGLRLVSHWSR